MDYHKYFDKMVDSSYTFNDKKEFMQFSREIIKLYRSLDYRNYRINRNYQVFKNRKLISPYLFFPINIHYEFYEKGVTRLLNIRAIQISRNDNSLTITDVLENNLIINVSLEKINKVYKLIKQELNGRILFNYTKKQFHKLISHFDKVYKNDITKNIITPFIGWEKAGNEYGYFPCHAESKDRYIIKQNILFLKNYINIDIKEISTIRFNKFSKSDILLFSITLFSLCRPFLPIIIYN